MPKPTALEIEKQFGHHCTGFSPPMNEGYKIECRWFGWVLLFKDTEFRIEFCPLCGSDLEKKRHA